MDRNELKTKLREENSSSLTSLLPGFYDDVDNYIHELEEEINKVNNPRSVEAKILEDELQSAINDVETIFIRRIRKITTRATSSAFSDKPVRQDLDKLLPSEQKVYEATLFAIRVARSELLEPILDPNATDNQKETKYGEDKQIERPDQKGEGHTQKEGFTKANENLENINGERKEILTTAGGTAGSDHSAVNEKGNIAKSNINKEYFVVRILKELPTFTAVNDRNYTTAIGDVIVLPAMNASVLAKRGAAHLITIINNSN